MSTIMVSGIGPGSSGTGRVMRHVVKSSRVSEKLHFVFRRHPRNQRLRTMSASTLWLQIAKQVIAKRPDSVIVCHPQTLGTSSSLLLLRYFAPRSALLVLDSSFFCIRSYNHLDPEMQPCLRCTKGDFDQADRNGCVAFPGQWKGANSYVAELRDLVRAKSILLLVQTAEQEALARHNFGADIRTRVVGLWADDFNQWTESAPEASPQLIADVVFHGAAIPSKGLLWVMEVARATPDVTYLVPTALHKTRFEAGEIPQNVVFRRMSWENGLHDAIVRAPLTIVPSLWSAPIEGALIKSLRYGNRVAVVENPSAFSNTIPETVVTRISSDPASAATQIKDLLKTAHHYQMRDTWLREFAAQNIDFAERLVKVFES